MADLVGPAAADQARTVQEPDPAPTLLESPGPKVQNEKSVDAGTVGAASSTRTTALDTEVLERLQQMGFPRQQVLEAVAHCPSSEFFGAGRSIDQQVEVVLNVLMSMDTYSAEPAGEDQTFFDANEQSPGPKGDNEAEVVRQLQQMGFQRQQILDCVARCKESQRLKSGAPLEEQVDLVMMAMLEADEPAKPAVSDAAAHKEGGNDKSVNALGGDDEVIERLGQMGFGRGDVQAALEGLKQREASGSSSSSVEARVNAVLAALLADGDGNGETQVSQDADGGKEELEEEDKTPCTCPICFDDIEPGMKIRLGCGHVFCKECMQGHLGAVAFPVCPDLNCSYELSEADVARACGKDSDRLASFQTMKVQTAVDFMADSVKCPNPVCRNATFALRGDRRQRMACSCGWPAWCTKCRQPWHPHGDCDEMSSMRERWLDWITRGRQEYHGQELETQHFIGQREALENALARQREEESDEQWKAQNCRCCPKCGRASQKTEGCDSMVCGRNYHGGDQQDGCGASYNWRSATPYKPRLMCREIPSLEADKKISNSATEVRHLFMSCSSCGVPNIKGPRFKCLGCESLSLCAACDRKCAASGSISAPGARNHAPEHVFQILFAPETNYNEDIPIGTKVRLWGFQGNNAELNGIVARVTRYFPANTMLRGPFIKKASYEVRMPAEVKGRELRVFSADCIQLAAEDHGELSDIVQAMLAQQEARRLRFNLPRGALVQLIGPAMEPIEGSPQFHQGELARIDHAFDAAGEKQYKVRLLPPTYERPREQTSLTEGVMDASRRALFPILFSPPRRRQDDPEAQEDLEPPGDAIYAKRDITVQAKTVQCILEDQSSLDAMQARDKEYAEAAHAKGDDVDVDCAFCGKPIYGAVVWDGSQPYHFGCRKGA